jgi:hypothetical protein
MRQRSTGGVSSSSNSSADLNPQQKVIQEYVNRLSGIIDTYGDPEAVLSQNSQDMLRSLCSTLKGIHVQEKPSLDAEYASLDAQLDRLRSMLLEDLNAVFWGSSRYPKTETFRKDIGNARWDMQLAWNAIPKEKSSEAVLGDNAQLTLDQLAERLEQQSSEQSKQLAELAQKTDAGHKQLAEGLQNTVKKEDLDGVKQEFQESIGKLGQDVDGKLEKEKREHEQQLQSVLAKNSELNQQVVLYKQEVSTVKQNFEVALQDQNKRWQIQMEKAMVAALAETHKTMKAQSAEIEQMRAEMDKLRRQLEGQQSSHRASRYTTAESPIIDINSSSDSGFIGLSPLSQQAPAKTKVRRIDTYVTPEKVKLIDVYAGLLNAKEKSVLCSKYRPGIDAFLSIVLCNLTENNLSQLIEQAKENKIFTIFFNDILQNGSQKFLLDVSDQAFVTLLRIWNAKELKDHYEEKEEQVINSPLLIDVYKKDIKIARDQAKNKAYEAILRCNEDGIELPESIKTQVKTKLKALISAQKSVQPIITIKKQ